MLKMTIDNEEVLSNNDISIKEEILSPSSTILNNVYPKSWEQDKDYVSRFYYPKDYSKLNIQNFSVEPEEAGTTIQVNESATLTDVDTTKESRVLRLLGQTSQVQYTGKNLLKYPYSDTTKTTNGITFTDNGDGSITINGTSTGQAIFYFDSNGWAFDSSSVLPTGTYTFNKLATNNNVFFYINIYKNDGTNQTYSTSTGNTTFTITGTQSLNMPRIAVASGVTLNNVRVYPQLELGSTATSFEPYVGGTASPNPSYPSPVNVVSGDNEIKICGKNLFDIDNAFHVSISGSGAVGTNEDYRTTDYLPTQPNTNYYFSTTQISGQTSKQIYICYYDSNKTFISRTSYNVLESSFTTPTNTYFIRAGVYSKGQENVMLEKGSTKTTYEPYIGNTYPIYLGVENSWKSSKAIQGTFDNNTALASKRIVWFGKEVSNGETMTITCNNSNLRFAVGRTTTNTQSSSNTQAQNSGWQTGTYTITFNSNGYACLTISKTDDSAVAISSLNDNDFTITYNGNHISNQPIELCKIGTYQDYIYKDNGSWYLHKEIGKVVLDGSENWSGGTISGTLTRFSYPKSDLNSIAYTYGGINGYCNYLPYFMAWSDTTPERVWTNGNSVLVVMNKTLSEFKTWLSTHNTIVYYVLATPTNTLIEDTNLIEQLESLSS